MTDNFTCPSCGWPQGRTHTTAWHPDGSAECPTCHQGVVWRDDAREGEEDGIGLVERLRGLGKSLRGLDWCDSLAPDEAADALERKERTIADLQTRNETLWDQGMDIHAALTAAKAEIAQLRSQVGDNIELQEAEQRGYARAQAEIERLRAALEKAGLHVAEKLVEIGRYKAEIERLSSPPLEQEVKYLDGQIKMLLAENKAMRAALGALVKRYDEGCGFPTKLWEDGRAALGGKDG